MKAIYNVRKCSKHFDILAAGARKNLAITEMKVMMIKFLQRYENLVELKERMYELQLTYHIKHSDVRSPRRPSD